MPVDNANSVVAAFSSTARKQPPLDLPATEAMRSTQSFRRIVGVDYTFECVGSAAALATAIAVTRPGGTVCLTGVIPHPIQFNWNDMLRDEKTITTTNAYDDEFPIVIAMLNDGRLKAEPLVSQTFPLKDAWNNLTRFEEAGRANIKMLIEMDA